LNPSREGFVVGDPFELPLVETEDGKTQVEEEYEEGFAWIMGINTHRVPRQAIH